MKADELLRNHQKYFVNSLCNYNDDEWSFPSFPEAKMVTPMLIQFVIMNLNEYKTNIFDCKLQQLARNIAQQSSLKEIYQMLWVPLFDYCCTVADGLEKETVTLSSLFENVGLAESEDTIKRFISAVEKCQAYCTEDIGLLAELYIQTDDVSKN